jgi:hypothetical protein
VRVRHTGAVPVGPRDLVQDSGHPDNHVGERRDVRRVVRIDEHAGVVGGQPVPAGLGRPGDVVDGDHAGDGLLLQPFGGVAPVDAGGRG